MRNWTWIGVVLLYIGACDAPEEAEEELALDEHEGEIASGGESASERVIGCADGEREGFTDPSVYPDVAGCSGAWTVPSMLAAPDIEDLEPACGRAAGDDGASALGTGCNAADLCAPGWGLCSDYSHEGGAACCRLANRPPKCDDAKADPDKIKKNNHDLVKVEIKKVKDPDDDKVTIDILRVCQNEKVDGPGPYHSPDAFILDGGEHHDDKLTVRAERKDKDGRTYTVKFRATDEKGKKCTGTVEVCVPHDNGNNDKCKDRAPRFNSLRSGDKPCNL